MSAPRAGSCPTSPPPQQAQRLQRPASAGAGRGHRQSRHPREQSLAPDGQLLGRHAPGDGSDRAGRPAGHPACGRHAAVDPRHDRAVRLDLGRLEAEAAGITRASHSLETTSTTALDTLEERRGAMDALAQSFAARADDIDARMRMFAQNIADTVNDTERRSSPPRRAMDEALAATSGSVNSAIESSTGLVQTPSTPIPTASAPRSARRPKSSRPWCSAPPTMPRPPSAALEHRAQRPGRTDGAGQFVARIQCQPRRRHPFLHGGQRDRRADLDQRHAGRCHQRLDPVGAQTPSPAMPASCAAPSRETTQEVTGQLGAFHEAAGRKGAAPMPCCRKPSSVWSRKCSARSRTPPIASPKPLAPCARRPAKWAANSKPPAPKLARGVNELPEETRASAAAMRRVVAGRSKPWQSSMPSCAPSGEPRHQPTGAVRPSAACVSPSPLRPPTCPARRPLSLLRTVPCRAGPGRNPPRRPHPQHARASAPARPRLCPRRGSCRRRRRWLRDVLRNASAKQADAQQPCWPDRPPRPFFGLTEEIARAIDDAALAEAGAATSRASPTCPRAPHLHPRRSGSGTYDEGAQAHPARRRLCPHRLRPLWASSSSSSNAPPQAPAPPPKRANTCFRIAARSIRPSPIRAVA